MDLAPERNATPSVITYGRRKQIPFLIVAAALSVYFAVTARFALTRAFECGLFVWIAWRGYRYWTVPMTPRYATAVERRRRRRGMQISPKLAFGVIGAVVGFYALLIVALAVLN